MIILRYVCIYGFIVPYTNCIELNFQTFLVNFADQHDSSYGVICLFSLKNPSYPEYACFSPCGVMCVDIHPKHPHMILAGLVRGNVAVYNLQIKTRKPSHVSSTGNGKHNDIVWQVTQFST